MGRKGTLFDDDRTPKPTESKEGKLLDRLKELDEKIAGAIEKVKALKAEKAELQKKVIELENTIKEKDAEIKSLSSDRSNVRGQIESLLEELESIEL